MRHQMMRDITQTWREKKCVYFPLSLLLASLYESWCAVLLASLTYWAALCCLPPPIGDTADLTFLSNPSCKLAPRLWSSAQHTRLILWVKLKTFHNSKNTYPSLIRTDEIRYERRENICYLSSWWIGSRNALKGRVYPLKLTGNCPESKEKELLDAAETWGLSVGWLKPANTASHPAVPPSISLENKLKTYF